MKKKICFALLILTSFVASSSLVHATNTYMGYFSSAYPSSPLNTNGNRCVICHSSGGPPFNPYGTAFWNQPPQNAPKNATQAAAALKAIEGLDSDGDGASNLTEINAGYFPGNASSTPPPAVTAPAISSFTATANPSSITSGQTSTVTLSWSLSGGTPDTLSIDNGVGSVLNSLSKTVTVSPTTTTTYTYNLTASNGGGTATKQATVTVTVTQAPPTAPAINSFTATANPSSITSGQTSTVTLSWGLSGGTPGALSIDNGVGSVLNTASKTVTVSPTTTTTYTYNLTASNGGGTATKQATVTVTVTQPPQSQPPTVDLTNWLGQWLKVTIKYEGYSFGSSSSSNSNGNVKPGEDGASKMDRDHENVGAYLKLVSWDPNLGVLQGELYQLDSHSQWVSDPLTLHFIGGTPADFLCWSQVTGDFTTGFVARVQAKGNGNDLKSATFKTLGGYYYESSSGSLAAGKISINGNLVPDSKVPVPK